MSRIQSFLFHIRRHKRAVFVTVVGCFIIFILLTYLFIFKDLPSPSNLATYDIAQTTKILDRHGKLLYDIFAQENRTIVRLNDIPQTLRQATIAIEDKDFYKHAGINPIGGILRAAKEIIFKKELQGGSTITQQLVKSALLTPERTVRRKIKEIILASWVELLYSKNQILELYLNQVPYGGTYYGVAAASKGYFDKDIKSLTLGESALLAGLPAAPTLYSPFGAHPEYAKERQAEVLRRMVEDGYITREEAEGAKSEGFSLNQQKNNIKAPHFVMYVKNELVKKYGEYVVERGGLQVTTTLDLDLQEAVQATVAAGVDRVKFANVKNGAALVTRPPTGEILAMVGSRDYFASDSGNFNVTTALRQPGSSIKPINYATGLATKKITLSTMLLDVPTCFPVAGQPLYCPKNYDGKFHGPVQVRFALGNSYNIPAVKVLTLNGLETMIATASSMGITSFPDPSRFGLSLTLGGGEVRMTEMATAFGVFANAGVKRNLTSILEVKDKKGAILESFKDQNFSKDLADFKAPSTLLIRGDRVLSEEVAFLISHILLDNNARSAAFGPASVLLIPGKSGVSVKTGTTDDFKDNWTIGFTPNFLTVVWIGNNDNQPMRTSGVEGAAPIWNGIMRYVLKNQPDLWPKQPASVVGKQVCTMTGTLPPTGPDGNALPGDQGGCETRFEYFQADNLPPGGNGIAKQGILIDKGSGRMAKDGQTDNIESQEKTIISDPLTAKYCLDCAHEGEEAVVISPQSP